MRRIENPSKSQIWLRLYEETFNLRGIPTYPSFWKIKIAKSLNKKGYLLRDNLRSRPDEKERETFVGALLL